MQSRGQPAACHGRRASGALALYVYIALVCCGSLSGRALSSADGEPACADGDGQFVGYDAYEADPDLDIHAPAIHIVSPQEGEHILTGFVTMSWEVSVPSPPGPCPLLLSSRRVYLFVFCIRNHDGDASKRV